MTGKSSGHGSRRLKVDGDEVPQALRETHQLAVIDAVGDVGQLDSLTVGAPHIKVSEHHLLRLADEGTALVREGGREGGHLSYVCGRRVVSDSSSAQFVP